MSKLECEDALFSHRLRLGETKRLLYGMSRVEGIILFETIWEDAKNHIPSQWHEQIFKMMRSALDESCAGEGKSIQKD